MTHELVACIVGPSHNYKEPYGTRVGTGKSCLCFRLANPGFDNYVANHPSVFSQHEFDEDVINHNHFLYWGSPFKSYPVKNAEVGVRWHIIEQTVLYEDISQVPFNYSIKPDRLDNYIKRILGSLESSGKMSYYSRDSMLDGLCCGQKRQDYPQGITKKPRGFVVVFDASLSGNDLAYQCKRLEPILQSLTKHRKKFIIVVTKRDRHSLTSLEKAYELRKRYRTHLVECSSWKDLNIEEVLRILTYVVLNKKVSGLSNKVMHYHDAAQYSLIQTSAAKRSYFTFLSKKVLNSDERLSSVEFADEYKELAQWIGVKKTSSQFAQYVLGLYAKKVAHYAGINENPDMLQEYLQEFVERRSDLSNFRSELLR